MRVKYTGPCIVCGKMNAGDYIKKRCRICYAKYQRSPDYDPHGKYPGPCVICGTYKSSGNRFVNKMCHACRTRLATSGNIEPRRRYEGPCIKCGTYKPGNRGYFLKKMCRSCHRRSTYKSKPKKAPKFCIDCSKEISALSPLDRCKSCHLKYRWYNDPKYRSDHQKQCRKYSQSPKGRANKQMHVRHRRATLLHVENTLTPEQWREVLRLHKYRCVYCGSKDHLEMDHIVPVSKGGAHSIYNVVPACRSCNSSKNAYPPPVPVQPVLL